MKKVLVAVVALIAFGISVYADVSGVPSYQFKYFNYDEFTKANKVARKENKIIALFLLGDTHYDRDFKKNQLLNKKVGKILKEDFVVVIIKDNSVAGKFANFFDGIVVAPSILFVYNGEILYKAVSGADMPLYQMLVQVKDSRNIKK